MSTGTVGTSTLERTDTEIDPTTGEPRLSHLVPPKDGVPGHVRIMEARIEGTSLKALCGHVLTPSRDPQNYPTCQKCVEVFKQKTNHEDGWQDC